MASDPNAIVRLEKRKQFVRAAKPKKRLRRAPRWLYPMSIEREYQSILVQYVNEMLLAAREILIPALPGLVGEADQSRPKTDSYADNLDQMMQALSLGIDRRITKNWQTVTLDIGQKTSKWNSGQWQKSIKSVMGVNAAQYEPWLQDQLISFGKENVALISSIKDKSLSTIESNTQRAIRSGLRHEAIAQQIEDEFGTTKSRAKLIARDQVSKLNGQLTQLRQNDIGIKEYIWHTSGDERVRASHAIMDGKRCRWDDPTVYFDGKAWVPRPSSAVQEHPGGDFQCRCWAEPVFDSVYESIDKGTYTPAVTPPEVNPVAVEDYIKNKKNYEARHAAGMTMDEVKNPITSAVKEHPKLVSQITNQGMVYETGTFKPEFALGKWDDLPIVPIDVNKLVSLQKTVDPDSLKDMTKAITKGGLKMADKPIRVVKINNVYFVQDGNHRAGIYKLSGIKQINAKILDLTPAIKIPTPIPGINVEAVKKFADSQK